MRIEHEGVRHRIVSATRRFPRLSWIDRRGAQEVLVAKEMVAGAAVSAEIVLDDPTVSRVHMELEPQEDGLCIRDLDSRNGTFVNGERVREGRVALGHTAVLRAGNTTFRVSYPDGIEGLVERWSEPTFHHLVGGSEPMRELYALLARVAPTDASLLIRGETGTGKELVARSVHDASLRRQGPYVVVDCAALPENLLDAELFGHAKGAFTGAVTAREGAIEAANGGTVFIDEVGELPMAMQPKLLRVLEQRAVRRIGETTYRSVDVRVVSATHRDLLAMVGRGEFREDLYFRLCVIPVPVPPLRSRKADIRDLARFFSGETTPLGEEILREIEQQAWRGNVRELRNFIERTRALGERRMLQTLAKPQRSPSRSDERESFESAERPSNGDAWVGPRTRSRPTMPAPPMGAPPDPAGEGPVPALTFGGATRRDLPSLADPSDRTEGTTPVLDVDISSVAPPREVPLASIPKQPDVDSPLGVEAAGSFRVFRERWMQYGEREYLGALMVKHQRSVAAVAREAEVDRTYIYRLIRKYGL
jgi:transcriptional regulator with GAF, ATPase, and Fis domain